MFECYYLSSSARQSSDFKEDIIQKNAKRVSHVFQRIMRYIMLVEYAPLLCSSLNVPSVEISLTVASCSSHILILLVHCTQLFWTPYLQLVFALFLFLLPFFVSYFLLKLLWSLVGFSTNFYLLKTLFFSCDNLKKHDFFLKFLTKFNLWLFTLVFCVLVCYVKNSQSNQN